MPLRLNRDAFNNANILKSTVASALTNAAVDVLAGSGILNFLMGNNDAERRANQQRAKQQSETGFAVELMCGRVQYARVLTDGVGVQDETLDVLRRKWGEPRLDRVVFQNSNGATASAHHATWRFSNLGVTFLGSANANEVLGDLPIYAGGIIEIYSPGWEQQRQALQRAVSSTKRDP